MRHEKVREVATVSILARKRFQFVTAILIGALVPWLLRGSLLPGRTLDLPVTNTFIANAVAIAIAFWMRLSVETYPGTRRSYVILPSALTGHGLTIVWFLLTRFPYDRGGLLLGFILHIVWLFTLYIYAERRVRRRIAVVPFGEVDRLRSVHEVDWLVLSRPRLYDTRGCYAIVADFNADLPDEWESFLANAALAGRMVYQVKPLWESLTGRVDLEKLSENSFGSLVPARGYFHLKTLIDLVGATLMLPLAVLIVAVVAIAIHLDDGGPVLFRQRRLGHAGKVFTAYKFRTMKSFVPGSHEHRLREALATGPNDPRVTRVGAILRKFRIDEIPQIFNILKAEMSWIGPRPEPEKLTEWFIAELPFYRYRNVVRPGISGWAQVNQGYASGLDGINLKLQYDFYYIKYFSPWLDLLILLRTIKTMLTGFGSR